MEDKNKDKEYVDFVIDDCHYNTLLTEKYKKRKVWHKPLQGDVIAHLPGTIIELEVKKGDKVKAGQLLLIHQAMKMMNRVLAPISGTVMNVNVQIGDQIPKDHLMVHIEPM